jgi:Protein of unknown function (DUF3035)
MTMTKTRSTLIAAGACLALTACDTTVQEQLGIGKRAPDEFQVVRRAPLVIPPDFALRPPAPGESGPGRSVSADAEALLTGQQAVAASTPRPAGQSAAEAALLGASPVRAEPDVRARITQEDGELMALDQRTFLAILDFQKKQFQPPAGALDPAAEAARLRAEGINTSVVTSRTASTPLVEPPS